MGNAKQNHSGHPSVKGEGDSQHREQGVQGPDGTQGTYNHKENDDCNPKQYFSIITHDHVFRRKMLRGVDRHQLRSTHTHAPWCLLLR